MNERRYHITLLSALEEERVEIREWLAPDPQIALRVADIPEVDSPALLLPGECDLLLFGVPSTGWVDIASLAPGVVFQRPPLIVIASEMRFVRSALSCHALDYLLRPVSRTAFLDSILWAKLQTDRKQPSPANESQLVIEGVEYRGDGHIERIMVRSHTHTAILRTSDIDWIEAIGNYVRLHANGKTHFLRHTMTFLETHLSSERFARVHRSAIVNLDRIKELEHTGNGDYGVILENGTKLPVGRSYRKALVGRFVT